MTEETRKRHEEAAEQCATQSLAYFAQHNQTPTHFDWADKVKETYIAGIELGYKEAIEQAKEWLGNVCEKVGFTPKTITQCVESFEADMNKFWEGE